MTSSLGHPANLCERLGLDPNEEQSALLDRFAEDEDPLVFAEASDKHLVRAAALCALWRMLAVRGSCVRVISSDPKQEREFVGFLQAATTTIDPSLTSIVAWEGKRVMRLTSDDASELRVVSNKPEWLRETPSVPTTFVILGARSSEPEFCATREAVESHRRVEGVRTIIVW